MYQWGDGKRNTGFEITTWTKGERKQGVKTPFGNYDKCYS